MVKNNVNIAVIGDEITQRLVETLALLFNDNSSSKICYKKASTSIGSIISNPLPILNSNALDRALEEKRAETTCLYEELSKSFLNELINIDPDVLVIDLDADIKYGCLQIDESSYITDYDFISYDNELFKSYRLFKRIKLEIDYQEYLDYLKSAIYDFADVLKRFLPETKVLLSLNDIGSNYDAYLYSKVWEWFSDALQDDLLDVKAVLMDTANERIFNSHERSVKCNLVLNSDFKQGGGSWRQYGDGFEYEKGILCAHNDNDQKEYSLASNNIRVHGNNVEYQVSFDCKILDDSGITNTPIFQIMFSNIPYVFDDYSKRIVISNKVGHEYGKFEHYEYSFFAMEENLSVGPIVKTGISAEYRNIMLTQRGHDKWSIAASERNLARNMGLDRIVDDNNNQAIKSEACNCRTIESVDIDNCYGCGACESVCPKNAISMQDVLGEGFFYPVIDQEKCVHCGICVKACPAIIRYSKKVNNPKTVIVKSPLDMAENCSSAGVSSIIADHILALGGYVCGAVYDKNFNVHHVLTSEKDEVIKMRRSKYVQSSIGETYLLAREKLEQGVPVMFSGTPCQIAGLHTFLGKEYNNLLTVDLICHGAPSPGMWRKYLDETYNISNISDIDFRYRGGGGFKDTQFLNIKWCNGVSKTSRNNEDRYYRFFLSNLGLRRSCANCYYAVTPRSGDISIGDWWAAPKLTPELASSGEKISIVFLNSSKALSVFSNIKSKLTLVKKVPENQALVSNRAGIKRRIHPMRDQFFEMIREGQRFSDAVKKCLYPEQYDVLLDGSVSVLNYGAILTNYALYKAVMDLGYKAAFAFTPFEDRDDHSISFFKKYTKIAMQFPRSDFYKYNWMSDMFLMGSDQLWNYKLFRNKSFFLDYVEDNKKKVSYATSFGFDYLTVYYGFQNIYPEINSLMKRFDYVSVREKDGVNICKNEFGISAEHVLDPVFLIEQNIYSEISENAQQKPKGKYIASYFLSSTDQSNSLIKYVSDYYNLPMVNMLTGHAERVVQQKEKSIKPVCENLTVEEWLYNIKNSEFVVTGSFHALCFSIIFKKNFVVLNKNWAISRMKSLLDLTGLSDRLIYSFDEIKEKSYLLDESIDYDMVYRKLAVKKEQSAQWLKKALMGEKNTKVVYTVKEDDFSEEELNYRSITNLVEYLNHYDKEKEDYILAVCAKGNSFSRKKAREILRRTLIEESVEDKVEPMNYIDESSRIIIVESSGKNNERTTGIRIKELDLSNTSPSTDIYTVSFDWKSAAKEGSFKLQLNGYPWDSLSDNIYVNENVNKGHYESIYLPSDKIDQFESGELQVRTDDMEGKLCIYNLSINAGNKPINYLPDFNNSGDIRFDGFSFIVDNKEKYFSVARNSFGKVEYNSNNRRILIEYQNEGYRNSTISIGEIYIEKGEKRYIYPLDKDGIYLMTIKREEWKVVDLAYIGECQGEEYLEHR